MDSNVRLKHLVKNRTTRIKDAGAHMYHAAAGVSDGGERNTKKSHRIKKHLSRFRGSQGSKDGIDKMYDVP